LTEVYRLTFFIGGASPAARDLLRREASTLTFPEPYHADRNVEQWTNSMEEGEIREALRAGLAAYVKNPSSIR